MLEKNTRRPVTLKQATLELGLFPIGENVFFLPGLLIRVLSDSLEITFTNKNGGIPNDKFTTKSPFELHSRGKLYLLRSQSGVLFIEELTENIVNSDHEDPEDE